MPEDSLRLRLSEDVTFQWLDDSRQAVVVSLSSGQLYTCNETTYSFLQAIDGVRTFGQIVNRLAERYDVPRKRLQADLGAMADELIQERLVIAAEDEPVGNA